VTRERPAEQRSYPDNALERGRINFGVPMNPVIQIQLVSASLDKVAEVAPALALALRYIIFPNDQRSSMLD
jgi:hypothetical protein